MKKYPGLITDCCDSNVNDKARLIGFACSIMSMSRRHSLFQVATLQLWISHAIDHKQITFFFDKSSTPIGFVTWAHLAPDVVGRLINDPSFLLHPSEWNEGGATWIIDFCFYKGDAFEVVKHIKKVLQKGSINRVHWTRRNDDLSVRKIYSFGLRPI